MQSTRTRTRVAARALCTVFVAFISSCASYTRATPASVRQAIVAAGVLGTTPDETVAKLHTVRLPSAGRLIVGSYLPDRKVVEASLPNARKPWFSTWSINVVVRFDSTSRASELDVHYSADSPL